MFRKLRNVSFCLSRLQTKDWEVVQVQEVEVVIVQVVLVILMRKMSLFLLMTILKRMSMEISHLGLFSFMLLGVDIVKVWLLNMPNWLLP